MPQIMKVAKAITATESDLGNDSSRTHAFGKAAQIRQAQETTQRIYSYLSDTVQVDFFVQLSKIYLITVRKRA